MVAPQPFHVHPMHVVAEGVKEGNLICHVEAVYSLCGDIDFGADPVQHSTERQDETADGLGGLFKESDQLWAPGDQLS